MLQTAEARMELLDTLRTRQKKWLGHVLRQDSLLRTLLERRLPGKKGRGRPRKLLLSWLVESSDYTYATERNGTVTR